MKEFLQRLIVYDKKNRIRLITVTAILAVLSLLFLLIEKNYLFISPFKPMPVENTVYLSSQEDGKRLLIDKSGDRLLRLDREGKIEMILTSGEYTFGSLKRAVADRNGNIYIVEGITSKGIAFGSESVKEISKGEGLIDRQITTTYSYDYRLKKQFQMGIVGIVPFEDSVRYLYKNKDNVQACTPDGEADMIFDIEDAYIYICAATLDPTGKELYYTTYDGKVMKASLDGETSVIYDAASNEGRSVPYEVSYSKEGLLYVTDIGMREILCIDPESKEIQTIAEEGEISDREIIYMINADREPVAVSSYGIKEISEDGISTGYEYELNRSLSILCTLLWIAFFYVILLMVVLVLYLCYLFFKLANKYAKILTFVVLGVGALSVLIIGTLIPKFQTLLPEAVFQRANLAAVVTAENIPVDSLMELDSPEDFYSDDYLAVREAVGNVFFANTVDAEDLYCTIYRVIDGTIAVVYSINDTLCYYPYDWAYDGSVEQQIIESGNGIEEKNVSSEGSFLYVTNPVFDDNRDVVALIEVGTDLDAVMNTIRKTIIELIINVVAIMTIGVMVIFELIYFNKGREEEREYLKRGFLPPEILRMAPFLVFFLTNLTAAFFPLYAMKISRGTLNFGLSPEVLAAIPISAEVVSGALFSAIGGRVLKKLGQRNGMIMSSMLMTVGLAFRMIPNIWVVTLGSLILGAGWALILLVVNMMLAEMPDDDKQRGFSYYSTAAMAGGNAGIVLGGFLIQWVDYTMVFLITAILSLFMLWLMLKYFVKIDVTQQGDAKEEGGLSTFIFLKNRRVILYFLMIVVPVLIGGYFLGYMYPIVADDYGLSETNIGYSMLINAACVLIFSGRLTDFFSKPRRMKPGLVLCSVLYGVAFLIVAIYQNIPALFVSLVILGIADSFGVPLQTVYYTELPETERYGYDRAMGLYSLFENFAQSIGSFVFSYVLIVGVGKGLLLVLAAIILMALIFMLFGGNVPDSSSGGEREVSSENS